MSNSIEICLVGRAPGQHGFTLSEYSLPGARITNTKKAFNKKLLAQCLVLIGWCFSVNSLGPSDALTHWGRVTHICVGKLTIIDSDNGLSPGWRQAIIWTNAGILLIGPLRTNFNEILIGIQTFSFKKMHLKMSSAKWLPSCLGLDVLIWYTLANHDHPVC